ncbi:kinase-like domain-containing protein [Cercophora samala]|uniref:Kinase-like domain-containing protein n=1 Tax=Cercophora samala TaxID=330535 RepID=A0AA39YW77_9PEZI|nr:kinase-like domain-containing protein [Cercophora samala]
MSIQKPREPSPAREDGCFAVTAERKYYVRGHAFIKRSLRPKEFITNWKGKTHVPRLRKELLINEAAALRFIRQHTDIPVPDVYCDFEDDDAYYLISQNIDGVNMADLKDEEQKAVVRVELEQHLAKLKGIKSRRLGGPSGILIPPYRVLRVTERDDWSSCKKSEPKDGEEYVFCHGDCSQHNVIVDPETLRIKAIIDWEYAGFFPAAFEFPFYKRKGPSIALGEEKDDSLDLLEFLNSKAGEMQEAGEELGD